MDMDKLLSFVEVYNCLSISRAAENLFISQPALSRRIQSLEEELKVQLFERSGNTLTATDAANILCKDARKIIKQHEETLLKMNQYRTGHGGTLRIGMEYSSKMSQMFRAVAQMQRIAPDVELIFNCDKNLDIPQLLINKKLDIALTCVGEIKSYDHLKYEHIYSNSLSVLIGRNHHLSGKRPLHSKDLDGEVLFYFSGSTSTTWEAVMLNNRRLGIDFAELIPCRSIEEMLLYVSTGKGVALYSSINNERLNSALGIVDNIPLDDINLNYGDIVAAYVEETPLIKKFLDILKMVK